jgi:hypothetical protein
VRRRLRECTPIPDVCPPRPIPTDAYANQHGGHNGRKNAFEFHILHRTEFEDERNLKTA